MTKRDYQIDMDEGGSPRGVHTLLQRIQCPDFAAPESTSATRIGVLYHGLRRLANQGMPLAKAHAVPIKGGYLDEDWDEARRLDKAYRVVWGAAPYGTDVMTEKTIEVAFAERVITARLDAFVELKGDALHNAEVRLGRALTDGWYVIDYKTAHSPYGYSMTPTTLRYLRGVQGLIYPALAERYYSVKVQGMLFDVVYRSTPARFDMVFRETSEHGLTAAKALLHACTTTTARNEPTPGEHCLRCLSESCPYFGRVH
jgi:hypothetical protein